MNVYEKLFYLIDKYIWVFHASVLLLFIYLGIKEFFL